MSATDMREHFILSSVLYLILHLQAPLQPTFIKVSLGADSSSLKVAVLPTLSQNRFSPYVCVIRTVFCKNTKKKIYLNIFI